MDKIKIFVDLDGAIADSSKRLSSIPVPKNQSRGSLEYFDWLNKVQKESLMLKDKPISSMRTFVKSFKYMNYLTSRDEKYRKVTEQWLKINKFPKHKLLMRPSNNKTSYGYFKAQYAKKFEAKGYKIILIDDDPRGQLSKICAKNNWILLKVVSNLKLP